MQTGIDAVLTLCNDQTTAVETYATDLATSLNTFEKDLRQDKTYYLAVALTDDEETLKDVTGKVDLSFEVDRVREEATATATEATTATPTVAPAATATATATATVMPTVTPVLSDAKALDIPKLALASVDPATGSATFSWSAIPLVDGYLLYQSTDNITWKAVVQISSGTATSISYTGLAQGTQYYFALCSYQVNDVSGKPEPISGYSNSVPVIVLPRPTITSFLQNQSMDNGAVLKWTAVANADGYRIRLRFGSSEVWYTADGGSTVSYNMTGVPYATVLNADVYAYKWSYTNLSATSGTATCPMVATPVLNAPVSVDTGYSLTWSEVAGAASYVVYRSTSSSSGFVPLLVINATSYIDTTAQKGVMYFYRVCAGAYNNLGNYSAGQPSATQNAFALGTPTVRVTQVSDGSRPALRVDWSALNSVSGYEVLWLYQGAYKSQIVTLDDVKLNGRTYTITGLDANNTVVVYVRGFISQSPSNLLGPMSTPISNLLLGAPTLGNCYATDTSGYALNWSEVPNASGYVVYRSVGAGAFYALVATAGNSYVDTTLSTSQVYTYMVCAYRIADDGTYSYSPASEQTSTYASAATSLYNVTQVTGTDGKPAVRVIWNEVASVNGYEVSWTVGGVTKTNTVTSGNSYIIQNSEDANIVAGAAVTVKVRTYRLVTAGGTKYYSGYSGSIPITLMATPVIVSIANAASTSGLTVTWNAVPGATGYYVYRSTSATTGFSIIATPTVNTYTDTAAVGGITYYYAVLGYNYPTNLMLSYSGLSTPVQGYAYATPKLTACAQTATNSVTATFAEISGVSGYEVSWNTTSTSGLQELTAAQASAAGYSVTFAGLSQGVRYWMRVRAYRLVDSTEVYSAYSATTAIYVLATPAISSCVYSATDKTATLTWGAVSGAYGYLVMRSTTPNGTYGGLALLTGTTYTDTGIPTGTTYYYKIKAFDYVYVTSATTGLAVGAYSFSQPSASSFVSTPITVSTFTQTKDPINASYPAMKVTWTGNDLYDGYRITWTVNGATRIYEAARSSFATNSYLIKYSDDVNVIAGRLITVSVCGYTQSSAGTVYNTESTAVSAYILAAPATLTATPLSTTVNYLSWTGVSYAAGYTVYRYNASGVPIAIGTAAATEFTDAAAPTNTVNKYMVAAYTLPTAAAYSFSPGSPVAAALSVTSTEVKVISQNAMPASANVTWSPVTGASGYTLYWSDGTTAKTMDIAEETAKAAGYFYKLTNLNVDKTYTVMIRPYILFANVNTGATTVSYGSYGTPVNINVLAAPVFSTCTSDANTRVNTLTWLTVTGASGYSVERSTSETGTYTLLGYVTTNAYSDAAVSADTTYYYRVAAYTYVATPYYSYASYSPSTITQPMSSQGAPALSAITQPSSTSLKVTWLPKTGVSGYELTWQLSTDAATAQTYQVAHSAGTASYSFTIPSLTTGLNYSIKIRSYITSSLSSTTIYSPYSAVYTVPVLAAPTLSGSMTSAGATLTTTDVANRTYFKVQFTTDPTDSNSWRTYYTTGATTATGPALSGGTQYYFRACAFALCGYTNGAAVYMDGPWSNILTLTIASKTYRALLIGNGTYTNASALSGPPYDVSNFSKMLSYISMDGSAYNTTTKTNQTGTEILADITSAFSGATTDDVSLFFYSGHGASDGAIVGVNDSVSSAFVTPAQLRAKLDTIPGTIVVMLDSCYSGQSIKDTSGSTVTGKQAAKNGLASFINAFTTGTTKSGELRDAKYKVLVSSRWDQTSVEYSYYTTATGWIYYGAFTRQLLKGSGYDLINRVTTSLLADTSGDGKLTLSELYTYVLNNVGDTQICQVYPSGDATVIFQR